MATPDVTITETRSGSKGRYTAEAEGQPAAELTYSVMNADTIIIDYTGVPDAWRGKGVGKALVERAVMDARERGVKIIPQCWFARIHIERRPDWRDVLAD